MEARKNETRAAEGWGFGEVQNMIGKQAAALGRASRWIEKSIDPLLLIDERQAGIVDALILPLANMLAGRLRFLRPRPLCVPLRRAMQVENAPWLAL